MLVAFSKTRKEPNPTCVKFDSQALEPIWFPTAASYLRTVSKHSVNFLTKRGEEKREGKQEGKRKGAPPEPRPSQREARPGQGRRKGGRGRTNLGWAKRMPGLRTSIHIRPLRDLRGELPPACKPPASTQEVTIAKKIRTINNEISKYHIGRIYREILRRIQVAMEGLRRSPLPEMAERRPRPRAPLHIIPNHGGQHSPKKSPGQENRDKMYTS